MADKTINELTAATTMGNDDLLVLQQGGVAKKLSGKQLGDYVYNAAGDKIAEIESLISGRETTMKATKNYTSGGLVIVNHTIYKLDANVASGETLTPGTNCHVTTVEAELAAKVPSTRTVNGKALSSNVVLTAEDVSYDDSLSSYASGSVGAVVSDLKSAVIKNITLDKSDRRSAYVNNTIGATVSFVNSSATYAFNKIINVEKGITYKISVTEGATVASDNARTMVVADNNDIVRDFYFNSTTANGVDTLYITPSVNGYLILCVDKNYVDISISINRAENSETEIGLIEGNRPYNIIRFESGIYSENGITFVCNSEDGTITANGTSSAIAKINIFTHTFTETKEYRVSGGAAYGKTGNTLKYLFGIWDSTASTDTYQSYDNDQGASVTFQSGHRYTFYVQVNKNKTVNNIVFKPFACLGSSYTPFRPFLPSLNDLNNSAPISIIDLGGKNDGSVDVGGIINTFTKYFTIFLPTGKYLVSTPISLINSLIGENSVRYINTANVAYRNSSVLVSDINSGDLISTTGTENRECTISHLDILCNGNENAIKVGSNSRVRVSDVSISNLGDAKGIYTAGNHSRGLYADNVTVFANKNKQSVGFDLTGSSDCRITNIEIMYCQIGIKTAGIQQISDVHIWTGSDSNITKEWYDGTIGIYCDANSRLFGTNVYIDTAYNAIWFVSGRVWISNLITWDDGTGLDFEDTIYLTHKEGTAYLYVNGGCYKSSGRMSVSSDATNLLTNFIGV